MSLLSGTTNAFKDTLGGLDGTGTGNSANFTTAFDTFNQTNVTPVLSLPDFARGPDSSSPIKAPNSGFGLPVTIFNDGTGNLTEVDFTLNYNPTLLTLTGVLNGISSDATDQASTLTLLTNNTVAGVATFRWTTPTAGVDSTTAGVVLGDLVATVPNGVGTVYKAKALLTLSTIVINPSADNLPGVGANAVQLNAYLGDVTGDGKIDGNDPLEANRVVGGQDVGFPAYTLLDPLIVGDVTTAGAVNGAAVTTLNRAAAGQFNTPAQSQAPKPPTGVTITPTGADPELTIPTGLLVEANGVVAVPVLIDDAHPEGSMGLTEATLALTYDPKTLAVSPGDIHLGSVPLSGTGWMLTTHVDAAAGVIGITLYSATPIFSTGGGTLVTIDFRALAGTIGVGSVQLVTAVHSSSWGEVKTTLADAQGLLILHPLASSSAFDGVMPLTASAEAASSVAAGAFMQVSLAGDEVSGSRTMEAAALIEDGKAAKTATALLNDGSAFLAEVGQAAAVVMQSGSLVISGTPAAQRQLDLVLADPILDQGFDRLMASQREAARIRQNALDAFLWDSAGTLADLPGFPRGFPDLPGRGPKDWLAYQPATAADASVDADSTSLDELFARVAEEQDEHDSAQGQGGLLPAIDPTGPGGSNREMEAALEMPLPPAPCLSP